MGSVRFFYADVPAISLPEKRKVQQLVTTIFLKEKKKLRQLNYIFCSDAFILDINQNFLQHDYYTDIITFDLSETTETVGEIYISVETVKSNSILHQTNYRQELLRVIFHGTLHLCGYGDKTKSEITKMRAKEDCYLQAYFQTNNPCST